MLFSQEFKKQWSPAQKIAVRFLFSYFTLFILLLFTQTFLQTPLRWFADAILGWGSNFEMKSTGSGDMTSHWVVFAFNIFMALIIGAVWSIMDRKRISYNKLFYWFQVILRVFLFNIMMVYGFGKIFKGQFPDPSLVRLLQPVGEMSPMGLAWTFMGHSFAYSIFIGFVEVVGGVLLLYRRTLTLGSIIIIGVMANVAMMNFTYDIPVKILSTHLIGMALVLFLADSQRFLNLFFRNKATEKTNYFLPYKKRFKIVVSVVKVLILVLICGTIMVQSIAQFDITQQLKTDAKFYGIWEVKLFKKNNDTLPPLLTDSYRWRYLILDKKERAVIKKMNNALIPYHFEDRTEDNTVILRFNKSDTLNHAFKLHFITSEEMELKGTLFNDSLQILLKRKPQSDFELLNRGFHWVNEYPHNQ
ncbi:MAG: hypothetical protein AAF489_03760 [Bacteroidota bacterium]